MHYPLRPVYRCCRYGSINPLQIHELHFFELTITRPYGRQRHLRHGRDRHVSARGEARQLATVATHPLALARRSPQHLLATVQIGITLVGVLAAAFSGASISAQLAGLLKEIAWLAPYADKVAFGLVVVILTYFTLVIGELVPKRIGLGNPEGVASVLAGPMNWLSRAGAPLVFLLGRSTDALLKVFRIKPETEIKVTEEEVRLLVSEGMRAGLFHPQEPAMIDSVMAFDRMPVRDLMTPRAKII